ncbi:MULTISPECIES: AAA family ATPase [unclassified Sinorhizobium]|uniref:AAA family ATPase n=1 Tax=unclassified Sinorhizobium TaxID=2613772 RepID=UPI0024C459ED|nr:MULTISPECIES: AAA family ATPase [unclassified Sinorhizobium]MDK1376766.1 AAA family ATPase [Sinorhizobium sp. 6-70]MDK1479538.1 AAA family ATPase [Sinorhizobium sp. 6-117]
MKINEMKVWRFQCFGPTNVAADNGETPKFQTLFFDSSITALIGRNGSGKSAALAALLRLFGETRDERLIRPEDFFVPPGETLESAPVRRLFVEVELGFPELDSADPAAEKTVPAAFRNLVFLSPDGKLIARVRLEASWENTGTLDGVIEENLYWLLTTDPVSFGEPKDPAIKKKMAAADRALVVARFIPASRDITTLTKLTVRSLGRALMESVQWKNEAVIKDLIKKAGEALADEDALKRVNGYIQSCWQELNAADTATNAALHVLPPDFQQVIRAASIALTPSASGRAIGVEQLSDGQRSLFHFALVKALLDLRLALEAEVADGKAPPFQARFMQAPALTIFAFEEPENHLAPYFLSRLITELQKLTVTQRVQGIVTSHSPAIVGRLEPEAIRHVRREFSTGISTVRGLDIPKGADEAAKFVREAVRAHPEIYFARHAIFGEGASEEIVLPRLAEALDIPMDRSFVAIVPIGGRYVQHFWRLVNQLGISHTTLLDLDLGRSSGDIRQFAAAATGIETLRPSTDPAVQGPLNHAKGLTRGVSKDWAADGRSKAWLESGLAFFETQDVFFSVPLDLDMMMLEAFPSEYQVLEPGALGPQNANDPVRQGEAAATVLKKDGYGLTAYAEYPMMPLFPWYSYLFQGSRGKPAVHLAALSRIDNAVLKKGIPPVLKRLLERVKQQLESVGA